MLALTLPLSRREQPRILCLGAHADDIEIGGGGTILSLLQDYPGAHVHWVVFSATRERSREAQLSADEFLAAAGSSQVVMHGLRDGFFPAEFVRLKELFEDLKQVIDPDLILTHYRSDCHQDHRIVADLTANTFRSHLILEYEIPKSDPDFGNPNLLVPLSKRHADLKIAALMKNFPSQRSRHWFTPDTFYGLMRLRGVQCAAPTGFAEGFYVAKLCLRVGSEEWRRTDDIREDEHIRRMVADTSFS